MSKFQHISYLFKPDNSDPEKWNRRFYLLLIVVSLWRLLYVAIVPLDLVPDEAYYWDWSRQLDWGYYSKPPLIAWINALSTRLLGSGPITVRLPAVILGIVGIWAVYAFAKRLYGPRVAFWSAAAVTASPGSCALGFIMTIDAPLVCFWSLSLYTLWRALEDREDCGRWWILSAVTVGLGLLSKQMMLAFLFLMLLFLWLSPEDRHLLKRPGPYLLIAFSLLSLLPTLWWNMQHDWITLHHTAHHFTGTPKGSFYFLVTFFDFVGSQLLVVSPLTCLLFAGVSGKLLFNLRRQDRFVRYMLLFSAVPLVVFLLMSFRQKINANWSAVFYPAGMVLLAAWGCGAVSSGRKIDRWRRFFLPGIGIGAGFAVLTYALPLFLIVSGLDGGSLDPTARMKGWDQLGQEIGTIWQGLPKKEKTFLLTTKRQFASELAFYVPGQPQVFRWPSQKGIVRNQYDIWAGPLDKIGWNSLILLKANRKLPSELAACFRSVKYLREINVSLGYAGSRRYALYLGRTMKSWPR